MGGDADQGRGIVQRFTMNLRRDQHRVIPPPQHTISPPNPPPSATFCLFVCLFVSFRFCFCLFVCLFVCFLFVLFLHFVCLFVSFLHFLSHENPQPTPTLGSQLSPHEFVRSHFHATARGGLRERERERVCVCVCVSRVG